MKALPSVWYDRGMTRAARKKPPAQQTPFALPMPPKPKGRAKAGAPAAVWLHLSGLELWVKNPRVNDAAVPKVAASIREFGFPTALVLNDATGQLVAGHTRVKAMCAILAETPDFTLAGSPGPGYVPARRHVFRDEAHAMAYAIADNRLSEEAVWDDALLREHANALVDEGDSLLLSIAGFDDEELAGILAEPVIGPDLRDPATPSGSHASPQGAWTGMPEFQQDDKRPFRTLPIHFKDQAAVDAFAELIGQKITENTRFVWFPRIEIERYADKAYVSNGATEAPAGGGNGA